MKEKHANISKPFPGNASYKSPETQNKIVDIMMQVV